MGEDFALFDWFDDVAFVGVVLAVFVLAEVLEEEALVLDSRDADKDFAVGLAAVLHELFEGVIGGGFIGLLLLDELERGDAVLVLGYFNI